MQDRIAEDRATWTDYSPDGTNYVYCRYRNMAMIRFPLYLALAEADARGKRACAAFNAFMDAHHDDLNGSPEDDPAFDAECERLNEEITDACSASEAALAAIQAEEKPCKTA